MYQQMAKSLLEKNEVSPSSVSLPLEGRKEKKPHKTTHALSGCTFSF